MMIGVTVADCLLVLMLVENEVQVAVYFVIALPPLNGGAVNVTVMLESEPATDGCAGAAGAPFGVTVADGADTAPGPTPFVAKTVQVYALPSSTPLTPRGEPPPDEPPGVPPLDDVQFAEYPVMLLPPSDTGSAKLTVISESKALADTLRGALGTDVAATGVVAFDSADGGPVPLIFVAVTVHVYVVPFESGIEIGEPRSVFVTNAELSLTEVHVTVYFVIVLPPFGAAAKVILAVPSPATPTGVPGAPGAPFGTTGADVDEGVSPSLLDAIAVHV